MFTPNGDGVNDEVEIGFVVFKAQGVEPEVQIFDAAGRLVVRPEGSLADGRWRFTWSGRDPSGSLVPPGFYICRVDPGTASGGEAVLQTIVVAY